MKNNRKKPKQKRQHRSNKRTKKEHEKKANKEREGKKREREEQTMHLQRKPVRLNQRFHHFQIQPINF